jgi:hypothetical protein
MVLDGSDDADRRLQNMLFWDVNNGIARRAWARNPHALSTIQRAMNQYPEPPGYNTRPGGRRIDYSGAESDRKPVNKKE